MAGFLKKTMLYLGLGPDEEYEQYHDAPEPMPMRREQTRTPAARGTGHEGSSAVRTIRNPNPSASAGPAAGATSAGHTQPPSVSTISPGGALIDEGSVRPLPAGPGGGGGGGGGGTVRPLPKTTSARPYTVSPASFNDAQAVADKFKASTPVIMNLAGLDRDLKRRLIDFSSGICYALGGHMERVTNDVYLLTPSNVELSAEDRRRIEGSDD